MGAGAEGLEAVNFDVPSRSFTVMLPWNCHTNRNNMKETSPLLYVGVGVGACRWFIVKKLKYFEVMLNISELSRV